MLEKELEGKMRLCFNRLGDKARASLFFAVGPEGPELCKNARCGQPAIVEVWGARWDIKELKWKRRKLGIKCVLCGIYQAEEAEGVK
jgi:hypothetical protein